MTLASIIAKFVFGMTAFAMALAILQGVTTTGGSVQVVISGGCLGVCATLLWQASSFKTKVLEAIKDMVTTDRMERRLLEERLASDRSYEGRSDRMAKGAGQ